MNPERPRLPTGPAGPSGPTAPLCPKGPVCPFEPRMPLRPGSPIVPLAHGIFRPFQHVSDRPGSPVGPSLPMNPCKKMDSDETAVGIIQASITRYLVRYIHEFNISYVPIMFGIGIHFQMISKQPKIPNN